MIALSSATLVEPCSANCDQCSAAGLQVQAAGVHFPAYAAVDVYCCWGAVLDVLQMLLLLLLLLLLLTWLLQEGGGGRA
jgi:hypothetical protein